MREIVDEVVKLYNNTMENWIGSINKFYKEDINWPILALSSILVIIQLFIYDYVVNLANVYPRFEDNVQCIAKDGKVEWLVYPRFADKDNSLAAYVASGDKTCIYSDEDMQFIYRNADAIEAKLRANEEEMDDIVMKNEIYSKEIVIATKKLKIHYISRKSFKSAVLVGGAALPIKGFADYFKKCYDANYKVNDFDIDFKELR